MCETGPSSLPCCVCHDQRETTALVTGPGHGRLGRVAAESAPLGPQDLGLNSVLRLVVCHSPSFSFSICGKEVAAASTWGCWEEMGSGT